MSEPTKPYNPKERKILYTFWDDLPEQIIIVDYEDDFMKHFARKYIFTILGKGIREKLPNGEIVSRRALNAQEILHEINGTLDLLYKIKEERKKYDLSLHSLYFHLQKLEEVGFIKTIGILKEGRHNVAYYGRPAKVILFKDTFTEDEKITNAFSSMMKLHTVLNPDVSPKQLEKFKDRFNAINKKSLDQLQRKVAQFQNQINEANIDPNDIQHFFTLLNQVNPEYVKLFSEILDYLQLELWQ